MKRVLFIDRDGTLIREPLSEQVDNFEEFRYMPGVFTHLGRIVRQLPYDLVMVTNQDGLGTPAFPEESFWPVQNRMLETFEQEGIRFSEIIIDKSFEYENLPSRKPGIAMLHKYLNGDYDLAGSFVIGDRTTDIRLAANLGCKGIYIGPEERWNRRAQPGDEEHCALKVQNWRDIADYLINRERYAEIHRATKETEIRVKVALYGKGKADVSTGIGFFDHMLDQLARHSGCNLEVFVKGDLQVDEHHTVEDTAIVLGQAFRQAWGDLKGMNRYGFVLPMDDAEASVSIDLGGRPYLSWNAQFLREKVGELPTELFPHFFRSFADGARCTLHIKATGENEHHKIEAIFKALARSIKMAIAGDGDGMVPSTKGKID
ncbi:MAG: bifunctional histidinol-phosphatase/imidazoleglycerol-phosphate dehydratase HisB [Bacteroidia bacterium]|nr:bifunctional histidinol-phosphatase/imidazoleglycerol-phosphate dehydratase HisB [Bacteroidia bacterium]